MKNKEKRYKMRVFISQPMRDRTKEEILKEREEIITKIKEQYSYFTILDTYFENFYG